MKFVKVPSFEKRQWLLGLLSCAFFASIAIFWQNCSDVRLSPTGSVSMFASRGFPYRLYPPTDYPNHFRFIFLMDMSNSMVSGPCPFDVNNSPFFHTSTPYKFWDPNKGSPDEQREARADGRALANDCYVDLGLPAEAGQEQGSLVPQFLPPPAVQYSTFTGIDRAGDRFGALDEWLTQLDTNLTDAMKERTQVLIVPVTGGIAQTQLMDPAHNPAKLQLYDMGDPKIRQEAEFLRDEHDTNVGLVEWIENWYRWKHTTMGTTAPGELLDQLYSVLRKDMEALALSEELTFTNYEIFYVGDGHVRPRAEDFTNTIKIFPSCSGCSNDPTKCDKISAVCSDLVNDMKKAWGNAEANTQEALEFRWSLIQGMPKYYGGGNLNINFVQLFPDRVRAARPNEQNSFDDLIRRFEAKNLRITKWNLESPHAPVSVVSALQDVKTFKLTHLYMYNLNVRVDGAGALRVDSDGDGAFDDEERANGLNPAVQRSNGYCLDSLYLNPAFHDRCVALESGSTCDPTLDSDADDLNECEEQILATDASDFDTDGDSIPDSLEWIYGMNPHQSDRSEDSNGDGYPNLVQFSAGILPKVDFGTLPDSLKFKYNVDFIGTDLIGDSIYGKVRVDLYNVQFSHLPTLQVSAVSSRNQIDMVRIRNSSHVRPPEMRLLSYSGQPQANVVTGLARMIDPNEPQVAFWRIVRFGVPVGRIDGASQVDLSMFKMLDSTDFNQDRGVSK